MKRSSRFTRLLVFSCLVVFLGSKYSISQQPRILSQIDSLISEEDFDNARILITTYDHTQHSFNRGKLVYPLGKIEFLEDKSTSFPQAKQFLDQLLKQGNKDTIAYEALLGMGLLHVDQGTVIEAQEYVLQAASLAKKRGDVQRMVASEFHLSEIGLKLGDFNELTARTENALSLLKKNSHQSFLLAPRIYNYKAALMNFRGMPDSANYYFEKAIKSIDKTNRDPEHSLYLPGTIYGNWFLVKQTTGEFQEAMQLTLKSIERFNTFLAQTNNHPLTEKVHGNLNIAYRNLGALYVDRGQPERARQIAQLGYHHAKANFLPNTVQYFSGVLMMGEAHIATKELSAARKYLEEAQHSLQTIPGENTSYYGNLYTTLADLENLEGNYTEAIAFYEKTLTTFSAEKTASLSQNEAFTRMNLAEAYAKQNQYQKAQQLIDATLAAIVGHYGNDGYLTNWAKLSKVRILFASAKYQQSIETCEQLLENIASGAYKNAKDIPLHNALLPEILLILAKSKYALLPEKTAENLVEINTILQKAILAIEQRKSLVVDQKELVKLISDNARVFDFAKKLRLELYRVSNNPEHIEQILTLNESAIYNRIRARLNLAQDGLAPEEIRIQENEIKNKLNTFFGSDSNQIFDTEKWQQLSKEWEGYLDFIKTEHPGYYKMRYETLLEPLADLPTYLDDNTTLIRFLSIENALYAYIASTENSTFLELDFHPNDHLCIKQTSNYQIPLEDLAPCLVELYEKLWRPLESHIKTKDIIIFPEGELFNLSFELLTPKAITTYGDFAESSLLSKYNISYNYSLLLLKKAQKILAYEKNFIAFAPEFDKKMKADYEMAISDSLYLDKTYLTLLPQPSSSELAKAFSKKFNGNSFLNEKASKQLFTQSAKEHKIIHIGTHAESNNVNPEMSRLVFAKNVSDAESINDNNLYTYEIYNQNLASNLAILTACETGKPTYQPGEGMISLAHAFNYAGSESILTSLWQIDEQSSTQILSYFYEYLSEGNAKDEALRLAKLTYLETAEGRTLHPQYWAGLVLMGTTDPIELSQPNHWLWLGLFTLSLLIFAVGWMRVKQRKSLR